MSRVGFRMLPPFSAGVVYDTFQGELTVRTEKEVDEEIYGTVQMPVSFTRYL